MKKGLLVIPGNAHLNAVFFIAMDLAMTFPNKSIELNSYLPDKFLCVQKCTSEPDCQGFFTTEGDDKCFIITNMSLGNTSQMSTKFNVRRPGKTD